MAIIEIDLTLKKPGIFSLIAASDFSNLNVFLNLSDYNDHKSIANENSMMLDDVEMN